MNDITRSSNDSAVALPKALRDPMKVLERGRYCLRMHEAGCHRFGEHNGCWRVRCNLGGTCLYNQEVPT